MSILIRTFFPCKCQKTQSNLALLFLAQMLQEPRGETGFRAGLPRGAQRVSLGPSFSPSLSPVPLCGQLHGPSLKTGLVHMIRKKRPIEASEFDKYGLCFPTHGAKSCALRKGSNGPSWSWGGLTQLVQGAGPCEYHVGEAGGITAKLSPEGRMCWMSERCLFRAVWTSFFLVMFFTVVNHSG